MERLPTSATADMSPHPQEVSCRKIALLVLATKTQGSGTRLINPHANVRCTVQPLSSLRESCKPLLGETETQ